MLLEHDCNKDKCKRICFPLIKVSYYKFLQKQCHLDMLQRIAAVKILEKTKAKLSLSNPFGVNELKRFTMLKFF